MAPLRAQTLPALVLALVLLALVPGAAGEQQTCPAGGCSLSPAVERAAVPITAGPHSAPPGDCRAGSGEADCDGGGSGTAAATGEAAEAEGDAPDSNAAAAPRSGAQSENGGAQQQQHPGNQKGPGKAAKKRKKSSREGGIGQLPLIIGMGVILLAWSTFKVRGGTGWAGGGRSLACAHWAAPLRPNSPAHPTIRTTPPPSCHTSRLLRHLTKQRRLWCAK